MPVRFTKEESDNLLKIMGTVAKIEIQRAIDPLNQRIAALEADNAALRASLKDDEEVTVAQMASRYAKIV